MFFGAFTCHFFASTCLYARTNNQAFLLIHGACINIHNAHTN